MNEQLVPRPLIAAGGKMTIYIYIYIYIGDYKNILVSLLLSQPKVLNIDRFYWWAYPC